MSLSRALVRVPPLMVGAEVPCVGDAGLRALGPGDAIGDGADEVHGAVGSGCKVRVRGVQGARCAVGSGCSRAG
jgi:hypothetical protein